VDLCCGATFATLARSSRADKSGKLDFGEWLEFWLEKSRKYAWREGKQPTDTK
jgi:hypothetical protein